MLRDNLLTGVRVWGVRRVPARNLAVLAGASAALGLALVWNWSFVLGAVVAAAFAYAARSERGLELPTEANGPGWMFGGERLAFRPVSEVLDLKPGEIAERLTARYGPSDRVDLVLWMVAWDKTGKPWTLVQDRFGDDLAPITATAVAEVPGACDPYLEAQRLALAETGCALVDVVVIGGEPIPRSPGHAIRCSSLAGPAQGLRSSAPTSTRAAAGSATSLNSIPTRWPDRSGTSMPAAGMRLPCVVWSAVWSCSTRAPAPSSRIWWPNPGAAAGCSAVWIGSPPYPWRKRTSRSSFRRWS